MYAPHRTTRRPWDGLHEHGARRRGAAAGAAAVDDEDDDDDQDEPDGPTHRGGDDDGLAEVCAIVQSAWSPYSEWVLQSDSPPIVGQRSRGVGGVLCSVASRNIVCDRGWLRYICDGRRDRTSFQAQDTNETVKTRVLT